MTLQRNRVASFLDHRLRLLWAGGGGSRITRWLIILSLVLGSTGNGYGADVLVVCPDQFRIPLQPWLAHRQADGLSVKVIDSQRDSETLRRKIRDAADDQTEYVVLVGDAPVIGAPCNTTRQVPIHYATAEVTAAWGSTPTLATDLFYGDFDQDEIPDAVVGRLPVDEPKQLQRLIQRIIAHEQSNDFGAWRGEVQLTGGVGGFGFVADMALESVARTMVTSVLPAATRTRVVYASPGHAFYPNDRPFTEAVLDRYKRGSRFWVYAGHGRVTALDRVPATSQGIPVLDQRSVQKLTRPSGGSPIALMLACYTGAIDASEDSLAEEMVLCEGGPIAVFAGSRVTMPYGNATAAIGLIKGVFEQELPRLGDAWLSTLRSMHADQTEDQSKCRMMVDALAGLISPAGTSLVGERREHMRLYNLIGDPTLRLHHPQVVGLKVAPGYEEGEPIRLDLTSPISGQLKLSFDRPLGAVRDGDPNQTTVASLVSDVKADTASSPLVRLPKDVTGPIVVRAIVSGQKAWATAAAKTIVRPSRKR